MHYSGRFYNMPRPFHVLGFIGFALLGLLFAGIMALLLGFAVVWLWNWLMPAIFGLPAITFWQAWGLVVLAHILFKSSPHHNHHDGHDEHWKRKFREKFMHSTFHDDGEATDE